MMSSRVNLVPFSSAVASLLALRPRRDLRSLSRWIDDDDLGGVDANVDEGVVDGGGRRSNTATLIRRTKEVIRCSTQTCVLGAHYELVFSRMFLSGAH